MCYMCAMTTSKDSLVVVGLLLFPEAHAGVACKQPTLTRSTAMLDGLVASCVGTWFRSSSCFGQVHCSGCLLPQLHGWATFRCACFCMHCSCMVPKVLRGCRICFLLSARDKALLLAVVSFPIEEPKTGQRLIVLKHGQPSMAQCCSAADPRSIWSIRLHNP